MSTHDRIEKQIVLRAPVERVWRALTDVGEFGQWFGVKLDQPFAPGRTMTGTFEGGFDEEEFRQYQHALGLPPSDIRQPLPNAVFCTVERMEPPRVFSFRWIPFGIDAECDPEQEPTTLVEFLLEAVPEGTRLTITESGFERVPLHRRQRAFMMNDGGWSAQAENLRRHVEPA
ncbi:vanillate O-demethylase oxidoreductase VanB [Pigmentiphaga sp. NML080357]|uniref:SRPBCC family protein n=1 Tax=Pigmentiphaga sp. NML080357 TaxID=2008675 RepID=UPI000B41A6E6|nr:SRPBCC family protein [Pigmentiphaga sp. NML080357]OVZ57875.1 vanillate O-demethylase oxidoreductase VanB [Pigmentiphaga sp. NML080357]